MPTIPTDDIAVHVEIAGAGVPVVLLHGAFLNTLMWQPQFDGLAEHLHLIAVDLRGHGGTPCPVTARSFDRARDVVAVLDGLNIERAVVCGLSMGGPVALQVALDYPERCLGLVLLATGPGSADRPLKATAEMRANAESNAQRLIDLGIEGYLESTGIAHTPGIMEFLADPGYRRCYQRVLAANKLAWLADSFRLASLDVPPEMARLMTSERQRRLPELTMPVLFMVGDRDAMFLPVAAWLKTAIPHCDAEIVSGGTHLINVDATARVNHRLLAFACECAGHP